MYNKSYTHLRPPVRQQIPWGVNVHSSGATTICTDVDKPQQKNKLSSEKNMYETRNKFKVPLLCWCEAAGHVWINIESKGYCK